MAPVERSEARIGEPLSYLRSGHEDRPAVKAPESCVIKPFVVASPSTPLRRSRSKAAL
jgi:hypothetical protein